MSTFKTTSDADWISILDMIREDCRLEIISSAVVNWIHQDRVNHVIVANERFHLFDQQIMLSLRYAQIIPYFLVAAVSNGSNDTIEWMWKRIHSFSSHNHPGPSHIHLEPRIPLKEWWHSACRSKQYKFASWLADA